MRTVIQHLCQTLRRHEETALTDAQLLRQFIEHGDEAAFATIVRRHGAMVLGVCRRVVQHPHDAEDAFQATFLILVRKAASIARRDLLASWLYGVAFHTARKARAAAMKRRAREKQVKEMPEPAAPDPDRRGAELQEVLDQELSRLPEMYRVPIILCDLEGKTRKEAAQMLGCPEGSLSSRLARARAMLAKRLVRHGLAVSGASLAVVLGQQEASAHVPPSVVASTIKSATWMAAGRAVASAMSPKVVALTEGVLKAMLLTKLKTLMLVFALGFILLAATGSAYQAFARERTQAKTPQPQQAPPTADQKTNQTKDPSSAAKKEREPLQGDWQLVACTDNGHDVPRDLVKQVRISFHGDRMKFTPPLEVQETQVEGEKKKHVEIKLGQGDFEMTFRLDAGSTPRGINLTVPEDIEKREVVRGIYSLKGDRLTVCLRAGDRPTDFTSTPGSKRVLYVMERERPGTQPPSKQGNGDAKAMQGTWKVVSAERYGLTWKNRDGEFVLQDKVAMAFPISPEIPNQVVFAGQVCSLEFCQGAGRTLVLADTFTLDSARRPKWITLTAKDGDMTYGIYALDRGELRLCWQFGQRRNLRPSDFKTRTDINREDDTEVWVLRRPAPDADKGAAPKAASKPVAVKQSWDGILNSRTLLKESPPEGFVVEAESWAKMWKGWRAKEPVPAIDFDKQMALILTVPGANTITAPELRMDGDGNLKVPLPVSTLLPDDGRIGYKIVLIDRVGIQSVNGRSITKAPVGSY
jgi:RNA polymerase sigma-70 factor (ECF subfamily)